MNRPRERLWVIAYDIESDAVRVRVHDMLQNQGERVQYSVFECWLDAEAMKQLRTRLKQEIQDNDSVRWYPLCARCHPGVEWQGLGESSENPAFYIP